MYFVSASPGLGWSNNYDFFIKDLLEIRDVADGCCLLNGKVLWKKGDAIHLTKKQIAEKLGIKVEQLIIDKDE